MDLRLKDKSVLITGGSKGIGLATAKALAAEGCRVRIASRSRERLEEAKKLLGGQATTHAADLRDAQALRALADARPMPFEPPVIRTDLSFNRRSMVFPVGVLMSPI